MKIAIRIVFWVALLFLGKSVVSSVTDHTGLPGSGAGTGFFSYWFRYTLNTHLDDGDHYVSVLISIEGKAPKRFRVGGGVSPHYEEVKFEWSVFSPSDDSQGDATVLLNANQIQAGDKRFDLDAIGLADLLGLNFEAKQERVLVENLLAILNECATGSMPRPRHHTYYFEDPVDGRLQHFALGGPSFRTPTLIWLGLWLGLVIATVTIKRANKAS